MTSYVADGATDWLAKRAQLSPNHVALIDVETGRELTYAAWNRRTNRVANALQGLELHKGDRVAVLAMNCFEYLDLLFACQKGGFILQALNWRLTPVELGKLVQDAGPRLLIYGPEFVETVVALREQGFTAQGIALNGPPLAEDLSWDNWVARASDRPSDLIHRALSDPWVLCYTGGTTGVPKAAILTQGTVTWNAVNTAASWGLTPDDVAILNAPLFHTGGMNVFTTPLVHVGGTSIVCRGFDVEQTFDLIAQQGVTVFFGVPTMFIVMQQHSRWPAVDFSRCKLIISGGAPCPAPVFERFFEKSVPSFKTGYGLTEAGPNNFWLPDEDVQRKVGSVGFPLFHVEICVVNETGEGCGPDEVGELLIRGPHVTPGFWNNPQATAAAIADGWLHTGDLARRDAEGYTYIVGRSKDMIISGGEDVYPAEVESVMLGHADVAEAALIGIPHPKWGEVGRAIVVPRPGTALSEEDLLSYLEERLARFKIPKTVVFVAELPKTAAGKVDKKVLRQS